MKLLLEKLIRIEQALDTLPKQEVHRQIIDAQEHLLRIYGELVRQGRIQMIPDDVIPANRGRFDVN